MNRTTSRRNIVALGALALGLSFVYAGDGIAGVVDEGCPATSGATNQQNTVLKKFADDTNAGVVFDDSIAKLRLKKAGGLFQSTTLPVTDNFNTAAVGDFDEDGWDDLVVGSSGNRFIRFYKNRTYENPVPDWTDPTKVRKPKFVRTRDIVPSASGGRHTGMVAGDFDQDGHKDFFYYSNETDNHTYLDRRKIYLGRGDGSFKTGYNATKYRSWFKYYMWSSTNSVVTDWNKDGWPDIIFGTKLGTSDSTGAVLLFKNDCPDVWTSPTTKCSRKPKFTKSTIIKNLNFKNRGANAIALADFTGDGVNDLIVGSPSACTASMSRPVRMYPGLASGGVSTAYQTINSIGAATVMLTADFSLDGKLDFIYGTDHWKCGSHLGGNTYYFKSDGDTKPFSGGLTQQLSFHQSHGAGRLYDFDIGRVLDYDHDPDRTPDFLIADGNHSGTFFLFANRTVSTYVSCGDVVSGVLDLGTLATKEMVVTAARIDPNLDLPAGTTVKFFMSNEEPANWQAASPCTDDPTQFCVSFPKPIGREVRWKAEMCSNPSNNTRTPTITGIEIKFDYTPAQEHYRSGVVVHDGVAYVGAFRQPGHRGHFYATNAGLTQTYWDAAVKLDAMPDSSRNIYTATTDGQVRLDFTTANSGSIALQDALGVGGQAQAENVILWQRSARFGIGNTGIARTRLGAVETSTPAVVPPPGLPAWYPRASITDQTLVDNFIAANTNRQTIVLFGSRDGALHAVRSDPTNITAAANGKELWAFIPPKVAYIMQSDLASGTVTAYPDGSPTVADVKLSDGKMHTVALVSGGNGSKAVFALDITDTTDPKPMWHDVPGGAEAGQGYSKPAIARVKINGNERFIAIMGTGFANNNPSPPYTRGLTIVAIDIATGKQTWRFKTACPLTTDIVAFETNDTLEPDSPEVDGFTDRVVFGDACGNVYKLNPAVEITAADGTTGWNSSTTYGSVDLGAIAGDGGNLYSLFSTSTTTGARGEQRPIVGTIGARSDSSNRVVLFFGTGGLESYDPSKKNDFYAVYADDGTIRSKLSGACSAKGCEKFYGGVVVTAEQVITTRSVDPPIGNNSCDLGTSTVQGLKLNDTTNSFVEDFSQTVLGATMSALFGDAGAIYFATLSGSIARVGTPRASEAGGDTASGSGGGTSNADDGGGGTGTGGQPLSIMGWRQVY